MSFIQAVLFVFFFITGWRKKKEYDELSTHPAQIWLSAAIQQWLHRDAAQHWLQYTFMDEQLQKGKDGAKFKTGLHNTG